MPLIYYAGFMCLRTAEVVLCLLVSKFIFELSDKPITWNLANISFPTVGNNPRSALPLRVGLYCGPVESFDTF